MNMSMTSKSLFCVLCWVATTQKGPENEVDERRRDYPGTFELGRWMLARTPEDMRAVGEIKKDVLSKKGAFEDKILAQYHSPYFDSVKECTEELRVMFFPEKLSNDERQALGDLVRELIEEEKNPLPMSLLSRLPISERPPGLVFDTLKEILTKWIDNEAAEN